MRYLTARPAVWYTLLALALLGQALDLLTTAATFATRAGSEANPLAAGLLRAGGWPLLIGARGAETLLLVALVAAFARLQWMRRTRAAAVALCAVAFLVAALMFVVGHNLALLFLAR